VFGWSEIEKREIEEREVGEKEHTSPVWYEENLERETKKSWDLHLFLFSASMRRKKEEMERYSNFPILPLHLYKTFLLPCYKNINFGTRRLIFN